MINTENSKQLNLSKENPAQLIAVPHCGISLRCGSLQSAPLLSPAGLGVQVLFRKKKYPFSMKTLEKLLNLFWTNSIHNNICPPRTAIITINN